MTSLLSLAATEFAGGAASASPMQAGYGISLTDAGAFEHAMAHSTSGGLTVQAHAAPHAAPAMEALFRPLEQINTESSQLSTLAHDATDAGRSMTPGEMVTLTVRCQEFMFHCQLTANVANRSADGLQQLFRQQS